MKHTGESSELKQFQYSDYSCKMDPEKLENVPNSYSHR